jgi:hypothetical protein
VVPGRRASWVASARIGSDSIDVTDRREEPPMTTSQLSAKKLLVAGVAVSAALDSNCVAALGTLGPTPATLGSVSFPITGGTVTVFHKSSGYRPYVQGTLLRRNSGLSLTAGGTTVELGPEAAGLLDKTFGTDALKGGLVIGIATITVPIS